MNWRKDHYRIWVASRLKTAKSSGRDCVPPHVGYSMGPSGTSPVFVLPATVVQLEMKLARERGTGLLARLHEFDQSAVQYLDGQVGSLKWTGRAHRLAGKRKHYIASVSCKTSRPVNSPNHCDFRSLYELRSACNGGAYIHFYP